MGASLLVLVLVYHPRSARTLLKLGRHGWRDYPCPTLADPRGSCGYLTMLGLYTYAAAVTAFLMAHLVDKIVRLLPSKCPKVIPSHMSVMRSICFWPAIWVYACYSLRAQ
jgi:hypothetical protein